jgi:hypothetical protein
VIEDTVRRYVEATEQYRELGKGLGPQSNSGPPLPPRLFRLMFVEGPLSPLDGVVRGDAAPPS